MAFTIPVAFTSSTGPPFTLVTLPVFTVEGEAALDATEKEVESSTVATVKVPLIVGVNEPPLTPEIVTESLTFNPCGTCVVTTTGLLDSRHVV